MLEHERRYPKLLGLELLKNVLGVVGAVVAAYSRMVAPHYKVGAAVVFAAEGVEDRLPRSRVAHSRREDRQDGTLLGVIALEDDLVGAHPDCGRDVVRLGLADQGVEEEAVHGLKGALLDVLVGAVDGVTGLKSHHAPPAPLNKRRPKLSWLVVVAGEGTGVWLLVQKRHLSADKGVPLTVQGGHTGVVFVLRPVDRLRLMALVVGVAIRNVHGRYDAALFGCERDLTALVYPACLLVVRRQGDGQAPYQTVRKVHRLNDALVVLPAHKAGEGQNTPVEIISRSESALGPRTTFG